MAIHVLEEKAFFHASIPLADQQRLVLLPGPRSVNAGDELYLRNNSGEITWVADALMVQSTGGPQAWTKQMDEAEQPYIVAGWLARVHPHTLPVGAAHLSASWVTLNSRTLSRALPWREGGRLVYHHTLHLVEGVLSEEEFEQAQTLGIISQHRSGHWFFPMGDSRKRFLVQVRREPLICALCGTAIASLEECTQDHRIPSSQAGPDVLGNLQLAHKTCNEIKGNALPEQYPPVFMPPGTEEVRYGARRSRRRPVQTPRVAAALLPPTAVNGIVPPPPAASAAVQPPTGGAGRNLGAPARMNGVLSPDSEAAVAGQSGPAVTAAAARTVIAASPTQGAGGKSRTGKAATAAKPAKSAKAPKAAKAPKTASSSAKPAKTAKTAEDNLEQVAERGTAKRSATRTRRRGAKEQAAPEAAAAENAVRVESTAAAAAPATPAAALNRVAAEAAAAAPATAPAETPSMLDGLSAPEEWLRRVQASGWQELAAMAATADWAARTATLRTMCALRRNQAEKAAAEGAVLTEATGKEGRFRLLSWKDQQILVEEKGSRRQVHQVHLLQGLAPEVYVWYVSEFGRTAPLTVAMALLALWQSGKPDGEGRVVAKKGSQRLVLKVNGDRLTDCFKPASDTAVA